MFLEWGEAGGGGVGWYPWSEFQNLSFCVLRRKPCLFRYFSIALICAFLCCCRGLSPSLCCLSSLSCVAVSRPCCLSVFYPYWTCTPTLYNFLFCSLTWLYVFNSFACRLPYSTIFGGAGSFTKQHFNLINGFSNKFWGWGGEDDDLYNRYIYMCNHCTVNIYVACLFFCDWFIL